MNTRLNWLAILAAASLTFGITGCQEDEPDEGNGGSGGAVRVDMMPTGGTGGTPTPMPDMGGTGGTPVGGMGGMPVAGMGGGGMGGMPVAGMGGGGMGGMPPVGGAGGVVPPEQCPDDLELRDSCDLETDCCARGLICMDFGLGTGPQCANTCDDNADPTGCEARELCNPDMQVDDPMLPAPGACIPSQECDIDATAVCGDNSSCTVLRNITICGQAGAGVEGDDCAIFGEMPSPCAAGLLCELGKCRAPCADDMCGAEDERCVDYSQQLDGQALSFCHEGCNIFSQDGCGEGESCAWANTAPTVGTVVGEAMGVCAMADQGMGTQNMDCVQSDQAYWGDCQAGHFCLPLSEGGTASCLGFCDDADRSQCTDGSVCVRDALGIDLGLCLGECKVWLDEGEASTCGEGEVCNFSFIGLGAEGNPTAAGRCTVGTQEHATGDECVRDDDTGDNSCQQGHLCSQLEQNGPNVCIKLCEQGDGVANGCPPGFSCIDVFEDPNIGACIDR